MGVVATATERGNGDYIFGCIASALETTRGAPFDLTITAIDNSPGSGVAARLRRRFPAVDVVENDRTLGYAANHNAAQARSRADYQLVANDDLIFLPGALQRAVAFLEDPANARVAVAAFQLLNPDGTIQPSTYSFPTVPRFLLDLSGLRRWVPFRPWTERLARLLGRGAGRSRFWAHDRTLPVQTFRGAVMLTRRRAACDVGPMSEVSLIGGEETEWHRRMWDAGWSVVFLHDARAVHYGSETIQHLPRMQTEFLKGTLSYFHEHRSHVVYLVARCLAVPALLVRMVPHALTGRRQSVRVLLASLRVVLRGSSERPRRVSGGRPPPEACDVQRWR